MIIVHHYIMHLCVHYDVAVELINNNAIIDMISNDVSTLLLAARQNGHNI